MPRLRSPACKKTLAKACYPIVARVLGIPSRCAYGISSLQTEQRIHSTPYMRNIYHFRDATYHIPVSAGTCLRQ